MSDADNDRPLLVAVFGMHRSGTSAVARALRVFDISLGDRLQPSASDNEKGFWEDIDVVTLSERALAAADRRWTSVAPLSPADMKRIASAGLVDEAAALLAARLRAHRRFGFKDPRAAKLGEMWRAAIARTGADAAAILAVRHPLSVARSLAARDSLGTERSLLMWLDHVLASLQHSAGLPRAVVDFDRLLAEPATQLERLGAAIGQRPRSAEVDLFAREFLDTGLRHSRFRPEDLAADPAVHAVVTDLYEIVRSCAEDSATLDSPQTQSALAHLQVRRDDLLPLLRAADQGDAEQQRLQRITSDRLRTAEAEAARAQTALASVQALALDRGRERDVLQRALEEAQALALDRGRERDVLQRALEGAQALALDCGRERDVLQRALEGAQALAIERAGRIDLVQAALDAAQALAIERAGRIETMERALTSSEQDRARFRSAFAAVVSTRSWRMTAPLRRAWAALSGRPLPDLPEL